MKNELDFGIEQYKSGNRAEARRIFQKVVREHPNYAKAYEWLYQTSQDDNERLEILKKLLEIDPTHAGALKMYGELKTKIKEKEPRAPQVRTPKSSMNISEDDGKSAVEGDFKLAST